MYVARVNIGEVVEISASASRRSAPVGPSWTLTLKTALVRNSLNVAVAISLAFLSLARVVSLEQLIR